VVAEQRDEIFTHHQDDSTSITAIRDSSVVLVYELVELKSPRDHVVTVVPVVSRRRTTTTLWRNSEFRPCRVPGFYIALMGHELHDFKAICDKVHKRYSQLSRTLGSEDSIREITRKYGRMSIVRCYY
jgi:hypothetical protein